MKILVIEDEIKIASVISRGLSDEGFTVKVAFDGETGLAMLKEHTFDAVVLDIILPKLNGWEVCRQIRVLQEKKQAPILMLSALTNTDNVVKGLNMGADDYLAKPFKVQELIARLRALYRRSGSGTYVPESNMISLEGIEFNLDTKEAFCNNEKLNLTRREVNLLEFFLKNPNRVMSRYDILDRVWGLDFNPGTNVVDVYVCYLRAKLDKALGYRLLHTVLGMGYIFRREDETTK
jgi:DNA-binding response OmpR family regulator